MTFDVGPDDAPLLERDDLDPLSPELLDEGLELLASICLIMVELARSRARGSAAGPTIDGEPLGASVEEYFSVDDWRAIGAHLRWGSPERTSAAIAPIRDLILERLGAGR